MIVDDFNEKVFEEVDITKLNAMAIDGKHATVITTHPSKSYEFMGAEENDADSLVITNPEEFWSASKYLVVVVD